MLAQRLEQVPQLLWVLIPSFLKGSRNSHLSRAVKSPGNIPTTSLCKTPFHSCPVPIPRYWIYLQQRPVRHSLIEAEWTHATHLPASEGSLVQL